MKLLFELFALSALFFGSNACLAQDAPEDPGAQIKRLKEELAQAKGESAKLRYFHNIALAEREWRLSNLTEAERLLAECPKELRNFEWHYLNRLFHGGLLTIPGRRCVAYSPDGKLIAAGAEGHLVKLWDAVSGKEVLSLKGHRDDVLAVAFSPDNKRLASGDHSGTTRVWELPAGNEVTALVANGNKGILDVKFSPDGKKLATGSDNGTAAIWDIEASKIAQAVKADAKQVLGIAFSPDGNRLATAGWNDGAKIWDISTGKSVLGFRDVDRSYGDDCTAVAFSPDGKRIAVASFAFPMHVFDAKTGKHELTINDSLNDADRTVDGLAFSPDGKRLAAGVGDNGGGHSGGVRIWDATTGKQTVIFRGPVGNTMALAFSPDGRRLAAAWPAGPIKIWDANGGQESIKFVDDLNRVHDIACSPDGEWVAAGTSVYANHGNAKRGVRTWNARSGEEVELVPRASYLDACVTFSQDSRLIAFGDYEQAWVWDTHARAKVIEVRHEFGDMVSGVSLSPDGKRLVSATMSRSGMFADANQPMSVHVWDVSNGKLLMQLKGHKTAINGVAYSRDGKWIASAGDDGTARIWDAKTGHEKFALKLETDGVNRVAFSPDSKRLAAAGGRYFAKPGLAAVWDVETGKRELLLHGHTELTRDVVWSPDGQRLATAGDDGRAIIWDAATGVEILTLRSQSVFESRLAFSPDGKRLFVSTWKDNVSGGLAYWDATPLDARK